MYLCASFAVSVTLTYKTSINSPTSYDGGDTFGFPRRVPSRFTYRQGYSVQLHGVPREYQSPTIGMRSFGGTVNELFPCKYVRRFESLVSSAC